MGSALGIDAAFARGRKNEALPCRMKSPTVPNDFRSSELRDLLEPGTKVAAVGPS